MTYMVTYVTCRPKNLTCQVPHLLRGFVLGSLSLRPRNSWNERRDRVPPRLTRWGPRPPSVRQGGFSVTMAKLIRLCFLAILVGLWLGPIGCGHTDEEMAQKQREIDKLGAD